MHRLNINPDVKPVKQQQVRFRIIEAIQLEVTKFIDSSYIREEQYLDWVANIVPVTKKSGKIRFAMIFVI